MRLTTTENLRVTADVKTIVLHDLAQAARDHDLDEQLLCRAELVWLESELDRLHAEYRKELRLSAETRRQATIQELRRQSA
jgi:hypothetical protein